MRYSVRVLEETMLQKEEARRGNREPVAEERRPPMDFKQLQQAGLCRPKLGISLLGIEWGRFEPREYAPQAGGSCLRNPPEFNFFAQVTLDAYVAAFLAGQWKHGDFGELTFHCSLKQERHDSVLRLEFVTVPERGRILPGTAMIGLLSSFVLLLGTLHIDGDVYHLQDAGAHMSIPYPGKLLVAHCPALRDRPSALWPEMTLRLRPTQELVSRARSLVTFVREAASLRCSVTRKIN
jgi:hypothetical protein